MAKVGLFLALLVLANGSIVLAETTEYQPKVANFGEFVNGHQWGAAASSLISALGSLAFKIKGLFELRDKCEVFKKNPDICRTCTTALYVDKRYGHVPKDGSMAWRRVIGAYKGQVFKMGHGGHRCIVPDSGQLGGKGLTTTFTWDDGKEHH